MTPDVQEILANVPGQFAVDCTDLSTDYPHGGTALGKVRDVILTVDAPIQFARFEEYGQEIVEGYHGGEAFAFTAFMRQWDDDAYASCFLNTSTGSPSGKSVVESPGTDRAGTRLSANSRVLVFSPIDVDTDPVVVFYKAMPMVKQTADLNLELGGRVKEFGLPMVWVALRDASGQTMKMGRRSDITI